jgi:ssDNA-binding Zn-finger/Zn-ribbon topoisomerase 1
MIKMANNELFYLKKNYCCKCRRWIRPKSILICPVCHCPLRLGNGASKRKHGIKISGITGQIVQLAEAGP